MCADLRALSEREVDCLKYIYKLHERGERVTTSAMRERLRLQRLSGQLSDAAVTQLFKALAERGYVDHRPYHGVVLTLMGERVAAELVRHHRLIELWLVREMGYSLDEVDAEAERLEHAISERLEERLDALLGYPTVDPHGDPIPSKTGEVSITALRRLSALSAGQCAVIRRVSDDDAAKLRYLAARELVPGARVCVLEREPFGGPIRLQIQTASGAREQAVGPELASEIQVTPEEL
ncbi:MAG: metal-dependent transcriptional regulator [Ktedonobacterales bacterium]|nr:metal-dependent transcriptional regulator [Ktedonobacterales bacterium]